MLQFKRILLIFLFLVSCDKEKLSESMVFDNCSCNKGKLKNFIIINDSLKHYQISIPNNWGPINRELNNDINGLIVGDSSDFQQKRKFNIVSVTEFFNNDNSEVNWTEEWKSIFRHYNVIDTGTTYVNGLITRWSIVEYKSGVLDSTYSHYFYFENPNNLNYYILELAIEKTDQYKKRLCELEPILESFKILDY